MTYHRTPEVDALRAFALFGICLVNVPFLAQPLGDFLVEPDRSLDQWAVFVSSAFLQMKFFLLFSFLFGWGMGVSVLGNPSRPHEQTRRNYRSRITALGLIGIAHGLLVFTGDILLLYAILGALLWRRREATSSALITTSKRWLMAGVLALVVMGLSLDYMMSTMTNMVWDTRLGGDYREVLQYRLDNWFDTFIGIFFFQGPLAYAAFALGLVAAKTDFFNAQSPGMIKLRQRLPLLATVAIPINVLYGLMTAGVWQGSDLAQLTVFAAMAAGAPSLAAIYLYGIIRLSRRFSWPEWLLRGGRNSLSCYVLQGVVAGLIFGGYGAGLFGRLGQMQILFVSILVALASLLAVSLWARVFGRGPLEPLLRLKKRPLPLGEAQRPDG